MRFEFATASRVIFGQGALREIGPAAKAFGRRALVVAGRDLSRAQPLAQLLRAEGMDLFFYSVPGEPALATIQQGTTMAKENRCQLVIGFGGGSALDAAKAIAAMMTNGGQLLDYLEVIGGGQPLAVAPAPFLAVPTTAGTGTEVTRNAVLASPEHRVKVSLRSSLMLAKVALVDPTLTLDLPAPVTASTGLDALTQLIEPYVCLRANPMIDALCLEGLRLAARSLRAAFEDGHNAAARQEMALASLFGGMALANAGLGAVHGLAGAIGGAFPAPHGAVCAILLPLVMETNLRALAERDPGAAALRRYETIARVLTGRDQANAQAGVQWVRQLVCDLAIPHLAAWGLAASDFAELVDKSLHASSMKTNPVVLTRLELNGLLERAL